MAATLGANPGGREDAEYQQALNDFHMGQWEQAIRELESLRTRYPNDPRLERMLEDARFKAALDAKSTVHEKRWIIPWRAVVLRFGMIAIVIALLVIGLTVVRWRVLPMLTAIQVERQQAVMLADAQGLRAGNDLAGAEEKYLALLQLFPDNATAIAELDGVREERALFTIYDRAVTAEKTGDDVAALGLYSELQMRSPGYRDTGPRILAIRHREELSKLYNKSVTLKTLGLEQEAIDSLKQIQALDVNFRQSEIRELLNALNLKQGLRIIEQLPPEPAKVPQALNYFNAALEQKPSDPVALTEARLADNFVRGRDAHDRQNWLEAVSQLRTVYNARPNYLNGTVVSMLYLALIRLGDAVLDDDLLLAYDHYSQACNLPVSDALTACAKASDVIPLLTPTATPTLTPTPGPTAGPTTPPTTTPTPTPRPLEMFRGRIIFKSDNPDAPGYYVENPDGSNREYLGPFEYYDDMFSALRETERFSPDHQYWVSTSKVDGSPQIILHLPIHKQFGELPPKPLTRLTGMAYDPVWAPDGSWIAFVSTENTSDDIWVIRADGSEQKALINNDWEWDKHPSWSADSKRLAYFSNWQGTLQIYVMDVTGQNITNISNVPWPEYDPIWVK